MPVEIILPKFGFTLETSEIVRWLKCEGDRVEAGEPICEVTTDKINMEVEAPVDGTLYKIVHHEGEVVEVTAVIAYLLRPGEPPPESLPATAPRAMGSRAEPGGTPAQPLPERAPQPEIAVTPVARRLARDSHIDLSAIQGTGPKNRITRRDIEQAVAQRSGKVYATPAARRLAGEASLDLRLIRGTGPRGRIQGVDVQAFLEKQSATALAPAQAAVETGERHIIKLQGMRRTIATRMQQSYQTAPHIFVEVEADVTEIEALRQRLKARDQKLSVTAILVKACAGVLKRHPWVNATLDGDEISLWSSAHIGVAVALDDGLIVPVIHHAERRSLQEIHVLVGDLTQKARDNALTLNDVTGGTFTISNMGMLGVERFTAIINPPQVAILAVGRAVQKFVPDDEGKPILRFIMNLVLSADHRAIDGAQAARFLDDLRTVLEDPALLAW
jgi:pyruvate dehydrogenase E2 component (dihydrolipoamide acetyltransferase)